MNECISELVKFHREMKMRLKLSKKLLWLSRHPKSLAGLTYVRKIHGELKHSG